MRGEPRWVVHIRKTMLSKRCQKIEASEIRKAFDLARTLKNPIDLSIGQPDFEVPDNVKEAACAAIKQGFNRYTPTTGIPELKTKLCEKFYKTFGFSAEGGSASGGEHFALMSTCGAAGAITLALMVILDCDDEVIITDPYFPMYKHVTHICGGVTKYATTYPDFTLKKEVFEKLITKKTKAIIISTPANPTGRIYSKQEIMMLVELAKKNDILIISDEVYRNFTYDGEVESPIKYYPNTLYVEAFSKAYGMPGWRAGYTVGPTELIEKMTVLQQWTFICTPAPFQKAVLVALDTDMSAMLAEFHKRRDIVYNALKDSFKVVKPEGAFYIFPEAPGRDAQAFAKKAAEHNVLIVPGSAFSEQGTHFRISYAVEEKKLRQGLAILCELVK